MTDTKFTSGPWSWEHDDSTSSIIQVYSESDQAKGDPDICRLQNESDAHLIAASPEMYQMLVQLQTEGGLGIARHRQIDKLLAKARGESV